MNRPGITFFFSFLLVFMVAGASAAPMGNIAVNNGRLSVEVQSASLRDVMTEIGRQAGFTVDISPGATSALVSTTFKNLEIQRGIQRLLTLVRQKNYFIHYGQDGLIDRIEIHGATAGPSVTRRNFGNRPPTQVGSPRSPRPPRPTASRPRRMSPPTVRRPNPTVLPPVGLSEGGEAPDFEPVPPHMEMEDAPPPELMPPGMEEEAGAPYIPPRRAPAYIPPGQ